MRMGRPKGSKNKSSEGVDLTPPAEYMRAAPEWVEPKPTHITIPLTEADLLPIRQRKAAHERAAAEHKAREIAAEQRQRDAGEIEELSVPQVVEFDMSAAFTKLALQKCREAGYRFMSSLRKTPEGWVFDASNEEPKRETPDLA